MTRRPTTTMIAKKFAQRKPERAPDGLRLKQCEQVTAVKVCPVDIATEHAGEGRQQHEREDHGEVLYDQPADCDASAIGFELPHFLQRP